MSIEAMAWAFEQDVGSSPAKFLLVSLADNADSANGLCFPSLEHLMRKTNQDRKTLISNLDLLCEIGLLRETGDIRGNGIKVYQLVGVPTDRSNHYVYRIEHKLTHEFYIGVRSCACEVRADRYFGSGSWPLKQKAADTIKTIIGVYKTRREAELAENFYIYANRNNPLLKNRAIPKLEQVPKEEPVPISTPDTYQKRNLTSSNSGTPPVPKTEHRTTTEPSMNRQGTVNKAEGFDLMAALLEQGVDRQHATDWLKVRKAKGAPATKTALDGLVREASKAGLTVAQAVQLCAERGWQSMRAEWINQSPRGTQRQLPGPRTDDNEEARRLLFGNSEVIDV